MDAKDNNKSKDFNIYYLNFSTLTADEAQRLVDSVQARDAITKLENMTKPARTNDYER